MVGLGDLNPFGGGGGPGPLNPDLPTHTASLSKKWGEFAPLLTDIPTPVSQSIYALDRDRVLQGRAPLSRPETARALLAATRGETPTKGPGRNVANVPGNVLHDVRNIAASIFRLPGAIVHEVQALPDLPAQLSETMATARNPGELIAGVARAPGIRFIPGAYTVGNLASGREGIKEAISRPLFTALDLLPGLSKAAGATKVAKAAEEAGVAVNRPLKAVLTQSLKDDGTVVRNALGQMIDVAMQQTRPGQAAMQAFSKGARAESRIFNFMNESLEQAGNPELKRMPKAFQEQAIRDVAMAKRSATQLREEFPEMADPQWVYDTTTKAELGDTANMDTRQLAYRGRIRDLADAYSEYTMSKEWLGQFDNEYYSIDEANRLIKAHRDADTVARKAELRANMLDPTGTPDNHLATARAELAGTGTITERKLHAIAALYAADALGADTRALITQIRRARGSDLAHIAVPDASALTVTPRGAINDMARIVNRYGSHWTRAGELKQAIRDENWGAASRLSHQILDKKATIPELADFTDTLDHLRRRDRFLKRMNFDSTDAAKAAAKAQRMAQGAVPSRFVPLIEKAARDTVVGRVTDPAKLEATMKALVDRRYDLLADVLPGGAKELADIARDAAKTWQDLRAQGVDPVFVHRVAPERLAAIAHPKVTELPRTPSQIKERTWDFTPYTHDATIALEHQGMELLARHGSEQFIDTLVEHFGKTKSEVEQITRDRAESRALNGDPRYVSFDTELNQLVRSEWTPFNPQEHGYNWASARLQRVTDGQYYLPKYIADNLERWHNPQVKPLSKMLDPIMKTFRIALLPFSPRWHVNNIVGGAIVTSAEAGPLVWRRFNQARRMIRDGAVPEEMMLRLKAQYDVFADMAIMEGRTMHRVLQEAGSPALNKAGDAMATASERTGGFRETVAKMEATSYRWNQNVDAQYRVMAMLEGQGKAARKGASTEQALEAGMQLADKVLPQWAEMTPIERQIMRYVFPFYGWVSYISRFALRYPFDHPLRASIMAGVTRRALEDLGEDGLPESFLNVGFFGNTDANGNQRAFRGGAMNPFADVANAFTVLGLAASANPVIATVLEQFGYAGGRLEAYPSLRFDPETGRLVATSPGLLGSLVGNTIPQAQILTALTGSNRQFNELARNNPAAARRSLLAAGGIPVPLRTYNIAQELAKRELATGEAQRTAKSGAVKSGDWAGAQRFPGLAPYFAKLGELQTGGMLEPYQVNPDAIPARLESLQPSMAQRASTGGV